MDKNASHVGLGTRIGEHFEKSVQEEMGCIALLSCSRTILLPFVAGKPEIICSQRESRLWRTRVSLYSRLTISSPSALHPRLRISLSLASRRNSRIAVSASLACVVPGNG